MINIGLFGYGTVGHGVKELLASQKNIGVFNLKKVFDRKEKAEEIGDIYASSIKEITADNNIDTVIECMGGDELPYQAITSSLKAGKNVISSNKETISKHLKEYLALAKENHASIQFEASVGGGIPLINPLWCLSQFDQIDSLQGILNGTSNSILTEMEESQLSFNQAVSLAQQKGFAEKDPSDDLNGNDLARKGAILASLAFQAEIKPDDFTRFGIENLTPMIISTLKKAGKRIKLILLVEKKEEGILNLVLPVAFDLQAPLALVKEETNGVLIDCSKNGPLFFEGKGAGKNPTASAILQDLTRVNSNIAPSFNPDINKPKLLKELPGRFYGFHPDGRMEKLVDPSETELRSFSFICQDK
ncbi:MAG: homoserine dehydrogenase [Bacilli bacterium]|jgi:homoserine dehydrogenase|nr:homoserine dehydrogenase [Bacilli bacterium]